MTVRNLDALFKPKAIALIGASNRPRSVGAVLARNLFEAGFRGPILTVNPREQAIRSTLNYRSVARAADHARSGGAVDAAGNHARAHRRAGRDAAAAPPWWYRPASARPLMRQARSCSSACSMPPSRTSCGSSGRTASASSRRRSASMRASPTSPRRPATSPSSPSRGRSRPPCSTGRRIATSAFPMSSRWATWRTSISATCSTIWRSTATRARSCSTSNRSPMRASSCRPAVSPPAPSRSSW